MLRTRSVLNSNRDCGNYYEVFNRIDWRLKTFIGFLQYTLHSGIDLRFIPNSCFSGGEYGAHFARILADVGKMWGNLRKRKIAKPLVFKGLAIVCRVELVPGAGVEPAQPRGHWCLRPTRLPIPPSGLMRAGNGKIVGLRTGEAAVLRIFAVNGESNLYHGY